MQFRGKTVLTWSLNNYLGLANHPEVRQADIDGATDTTLSFTAACADNRNQYRAVMTNSCGSAATTDAATLTVRDAEPPSLTCPPSINLPTAQGQC